MGRSAASCFKIMACGGSDPAKDNDDEQLVAPEVKSDRSRWSFQKRSARHRVLNNSVLSESPVENEEIPECIDANTKATTDFDTAEKVSAIPCAVEKPQLSAPSEVKAPEPVVKTKPDISEEEPAIVIIQAAIRAYMAQKELVKLRKVIKMQALVRGHLVRRHAVGTLRCVQAIVKMQALVRVRHTSRLVEGSSIEKNAEAKAMEKENVQNKANVTYASIERLLSNRFAQQLLESKPKTKPIHIKCVTSKADSGWLWLERWMSASSSKQSPSLEASNEEQIRELNEKIVSHSVTGQTPEVVLCQPTSSHGETDSVTADDGSDMLASAAKDLKIDETPAVNESIVLLETEDQITANNVADSCSTAKVNEIHEISNAEPDTLSISVKSEGDNEQPRHSGKRVAPEQLVPDSRKPSFGSGRVSNPELTAAQSKFEELTSATMSLDPVSSPYEEVMAVPAGEVDRNASMPTDIRLKDNFASDNLLAQVGGSECGTELSISSTLDSPDRDEYAEKGIQAQITDEASKTVSAEHHDDEVHMDKESADSISKVDNAVVVAEAVEPDDLEIVKLDAEVTAETTPQHYIPSPEASPRSHMTVPESQGTPASQASVNTKGNRAEKSILSHKRKSLSAGKRSPSNPNQESASSNSKEFPRDRKTMRRRSMKPEDAEQEPRDSNSNSTGSIPRFMQVTESARAKLNTNNSPRSSPDVHDKDLTTKKRHSLTEVNGRQGSSNIRQHSGKPNRTQAQERKWVR